MLRFRAPTAGSLPGDVTDLFAVGQMIGGAMQPGNFFAAPDLRLFWINARAETIPWEIFRGRLVDASQTRSQKIFLSWHVNEEVAAEPIVSVKLDVEAKQIHVTRGILAYVWEGYDAGGGVIESREATKWTRELVGTIALDQFADLESVQDELICLLWQSVVGTSRLPLTSVEAPLPAYTFGQFHYRHQTEAGDVPIASWENLLAEGMGPELGAGESIKTVEFVLRHIAPEQLPRFVEVLLSSKPGGWATGALREFWQRMFNDVSLSPYTGFADRALAALDLLAEQRAIGADERIDFLGFLLRQLGRHLTAYDLVTFHHRGANYPDALLLDALLKRYLEVLERFPDWFVGDDPQGRRRRRALRQGCLMRWHYEGHLVPDLPTSPGENARVLPVSHPRVPEEQILQTVRRTKQLFADDPLVGLLTPRARLVLGKSVADLTDVEERGELGRGVFIDRPLGYAKEVGAPDLTPLLAHEAFSPSIARRRWQELVLLCEAIGVAVDRAGLQALFDDGAWPPGLPHALIAECPRPTAALCDVRKVAGDFVIERTRPLGLSNLLNQCGLALGGGPFRLCVLVFNSQGEPVLALFDGELQRQVDLSVDGGEGFVVRTGVELPRAGLRVRE